jgi:hypothetical protein
MLTHRMFQCRIPLQRQNGATDVSDESAGALIDRQRWQTTLPENLYDALVEWMRGQVFDLELIRQYDQGASGSFVAGVMMHHHEGRTRGAILKIVPRDLAQTESRGVQRAAAAGPADFVAAHLADTFAPDALPGASGAWLQLQDVAIDGSAAMQALSALARDSAYGDHCATILATLVREWNLGVPDPRPRTATAAEYLRQDLIGRRAGLAAFAREAGWDPDHPPPLITLPGRAAPLPNPLILLGATPPEGKPVSIFLGRGHGDLHPGNIMVPMAGDRAVPDRFRLIDLGRFSTRMEISRDPAKLLLSIAAGWLADHGTDAPVRGELAKIVADPVGYVATAATRGYLRDVRALREAAAIWAVERGLVEQWATQHQLVLGAAALRTVGREELTLNDRWWHFEVAAHALTPFLASSAEGTAVPVRTEPPKLPFEPTDTPEDDLHRLVNLLREVLEAEDDRRLVVLFGAGVTSTRVPDVALLTTLAFDFADQHGSTRLRTDLTGALPNRPGAQQVQIARYSEALQFVHEVRGPDALRAFLQQVSMQALINDRPMELSNRPLGDQQYAERERRARDWQPPEGLSLFADLLPRHGHNVHPILLTTNFDPLVEAALLRAGLAIDPSHAVAGPGQSMAALRGGVARWTVVHLHGTPHGDSLHYPAKIAQPHAEVEDWLASLMRGNRLLVLGYSGWDGLLQRTMRKHFGRRVEEKADESTEVLWAVYEPRHEHPNVDPALADFFERNDGRGVTAFYGIDSDRVMRTLNEELSGRRLPATTQPTFYSTVKELSLFYQFGHSHIRPDTRPAFIFWPHRLREPHLIHGVHALTAAMLSKRSVPIELHLDDTDMTGPYADDRAAEFTEAVHGWFQKCGAAEPPQIFRIRRLLEQLSEEERALRLWRLATSLFRRENTALDALLATKVVSADHGDTTVEPGGAQRLLRPLYTWLALDDAMTRHRDERAAESTVVTLGGIDEQKMWDLWRARRGTAPDAGMSVASLFVPRLEMPANPWKQDELKRNDPFGRPNLERLLVRSAGSWESGEDLLEWVFTAASRLAALASDGAVPELRAPDGTPMSWSVASALLKQLPKATCRQITENVASWFYHDAADIR